jgi:hypothetical protein
MNKYHQRIVIAVLLLLLSAVVYLLHFVIFRDAHHIFIYMVGDVAFVFIEVLLVTLIIHQVLSEREKRALLGKLNMVIGAFFSEVGTELLELLMKFDKSPDRIGAEMVVGADWTASRFKRARVAVDRHESDIDSRAGDIEGLRRFMVEKRRFLLALLENPNLLEHEFFTEMLWAVFHLAEELFHRRRIKDSPDKDAEHLSGDINRVHKLLLRQWLFHMEHLKARYPYLFSLALRTNPFDPAASVVLGAGPA